MLSLDPAKAHGHDGILTRILKECAPIFSSSLCKLLNKSLCLAKVPSNWKLENLIPIFKLRVNDHVENYRPISLLSIVGKVLERCILNRILSHIQSLFHTAQHAFMKGKSCMTHLLSVLNITCQNLDKGKETDVFMYISKALFSGPP